PAPKRTSPARTPPVTASSRRASWWRTPPTVLSGLSSPTEPAFYARNFHHGRQLAAPGRDPQDGHQEACRRRLGRSAPQGPRRQGPDPEGGRPPGAQGLPPGQRGDQARPGPAE